jgi:carbon-monoxide dehydrogenase medium subunit
LVVDGPRGRRQIRLGLGALSYVPMFTQLDLPVDTTVDGAVDAAKQAAESLIDPIPDVRGGSAYKKRLGLFAVEEAVRRSWKEQPDAQRTSLWGRRRRR